MNKKASLDVLCFPSRTMYCMGPSPHSNVCDCRSILATVPDEWQASTTSLSENHKHNEKKSTEQEEAHFVVLVESLSP